MGQDGPPDATVKTDLQCLPSRSVHFASCVLLHAILQGCLVDHDSGCLGVVSQVLARDSVSRVENIAVCLAHQDSTVGIQAVVHFRHAKLFKSEFTRHHTIHLRSFG